jgi:hypothetical protein
MGYYFLQRGERTEPSVLGRVNGKKSIVINSSSLFNTGLYGVMGLAKVQPEYASVSLTALKRAAVASNN